MIEVKKDDRNINYSSIMNLADDIKSRLSERKLSEFIKHFWRTADPAHYIHNWHIDAICDHLEAVSAGQIKRLIINIPPRHQKSLTVAVFWPAWHWLRSPSTQWLFSSYAHSLSVRDSVKCRAVIESPMYQKFYGDRFRLAGDQNTKINFRNDKNGYRMATSVGGSNTGEGGDIIVCDDANNMNEIMSDARRSAVNDWNDIVMSTRLNDPQNGARVIIAQRGHENDLTGHLLARETGWEHLCLPARYESKHPFKSKTSLNFLDIREKEGDLLWAARFGEKEILELENALGTHGTAGQLQQRPAPSGGFMIRLDWFKRYNTPPDNFLRILQSWDTAQKASDIAAFSVCTTWGEAENKHLYLLDVFRERLEFPALERAVDSLFEKWKPAAVLIEDKSSGSSLIQTKRYRTPINIIPVMPEGDKITRAYVVTPAIESGRVWLPEKAAWLMDLENEILHFPNSEYKDQIDSMTQLLKYARSVPRPVWI